jgi:hypothetical protein
MEGGFKLLLLKRKKLAIMLSVFFIVACTALAFFVLRSGSRRFEGVIVEEKEELYWHEYEKDLFFPSPSEVPYLVKRLKVRAVNGKTLDIAVCPWEEERLEVGMRIKGKFERKKEIEFGGLNFILFRAGRNKIELHGAPDGVLKEFRHLKKDSSLAIRNGRGR